jgi:phosphopantetheine adenylyltransferase/dephospho-CoA kinase
MEPALTVVIGLTGGIASGKSVVSAMLAEHGAHILDADKVGHEAYAPGSACYNDVISAFGDDIVAPDREIDRRSLGSKVFGDPAQRRKLEGIVWPWMRETMKQRLDDLRAQNVPVVVLEAAVLIEAGWQPLVDRVWLVTANRDIARERIISRNGLEAAQAEARIDAQLTNEERAQHADLIIENNRSLDDLRARVDDAWRTLQAAGAGAAAGRDA